MLNTKSLIVAAALVAGVTGAARAQAYGNVTVGGAFAPGVFGQISIGSNAPPPVMNVQPVIVGRPVYGAAPIYLHVAPQEYREWGRYCGKYRACGQPVHFVRVEQNNRWWDRHVDHHPHHRPNHYRHDDGNRWDNRHDNRRDHRGDRDQRRHNQENYWEPRFESKRGER
ncbi:MAG: hypothetical protein V4627_15960 [Pseudomonadota bacterium]